MGNKPSEDEHYPCSYEGCKNPASHILVDYNHEVIGSGILFCKHHAYIEDREECPCCDHYEIDFDDYSFLPTYPEGTLDPDGCCSEHP